MAAWNAQELANGQLPNAKGTLFTATAPTIVREWHVANTSGATTETVVLYYKKATSRIVGRVVLAPNESADIIDESTPLLVLDSGDLLEGSSTNATTVDYAIGGAVFS